MIKAQFMQLWDGLTTDNESTVLVMGATNRPKDVDKAILRYRGVLFLNFLYLQCSSDPGSARCLFDPWIRLFFPSVAHSESGGFFTLESRIRFFGSRIPNP